MILGKTKIQTKFYSFSSDRNLFASVGADGSAR